MAADRMRSFIESESNILPDSADSDIFITMDNLRFELGATVPFREVCVDRVKLACDDDGEGPAILCLHAIGHGASDFARLRAEFADRYRVIALDWPSHGRSEADHGPASARRYATLLAKFMDAACIDRAVLVGNSIGGAAALQYAHSNPDRVCGLVLENPGGLAAANDRLTRAGIGALVAFFKVGARGAWWFPAAYRAYYRRVLQNYEASAQRERIAAAGLEMAPILAEAWASFATPEADIRALVPEIECPVLVAWAKNDQLVKLKRSQPTIGKFRDARLVTFDAGHAAHLETPAEFASALDSFLAEIGWIAHGDAHWCSAQLES